MEQLLLSLRGIANDLQDEGQRHFESHIFFDGGCNNGQPTAWAQQLITLIEKTVCSLGDDAPLGSRWDTPYGLQFSWTIGLKKMPLIVHLKDKSKVRSGKRWSQVMYMSYILNFSANYSPLGMSSGAILNDEITASSPKKGMLNFDRNGPDRARLNGLTCWKPDESDAKPYIMLDLGEPMSVTGLLVQMEPSVHVSRIQLRYVESSDGLKRRDTLRLGEDEWTRYRDTPDGPVKNLTVSPARNQKPVTVLLKQPIKTRFLRIYPTRCHGMRFEVLGHPLSNRLANTYILMTDGDVKFKSEAARSLLDITAHDPAVGAVCARTHPIGSGPVAWYQIFDYAIAHWLGKTADNMMGTVLCCPGCFSVYRANAVRDGLPEYSTHVKEANDFLVKDMGEDRWFCTLLVKNGWALEYSAMTEDSTYCPETFEELFKQRRRWLLSGLVNPVLIIQIWKTIVRNNPNFSRLFLLYQILLLFSFIVTPGTCLILVAGGLEFAFGMSLEISMIVLSIAAVSYGAACLYTPRDLQLRVAKILAAAFSVVMFAVALGSSIAVFQDLHLQLTDGTGTPSVDILIIFSFVGIYIVTAMFHPSEFSCLFYSVLYLLCLPTTCVLLPIYSICNLNDRSWGTRETTNTDKGDSDADGLSIDADTRIRVSCQDQGEEQTDNTINDSDTPTEGQENNGQQISEADLNIERNGLAKSKYKDNAGETDGRHLEHR
ncbi:EDIL3 [Branchiostoma lanceolatum]|uniref:chitin synthase n=1 Tax=Branchiostoma lanceolatum TaxID=7740 RepID=A0A8K0ABY1_BRALA|nr:EDIL3 [Branchiostoma lanceolatum]